MPATSPRCANCRVEYDIRRDITSQLDTISSPVYHLLQSREPPNPSETLTIKNMLCEARDILAAVDAMADDLCEVLKSLGDKQRHHQALILEHAYLLAPMRNLPQDVLGHIFRLCLPTSEEASFDSKSAPLVLTQVCKEWRQCAFDCQRLWASFTINSEAAPSSSLVRRWLSHAKSSPLSPSLLLKGTGAEARRAWPAVADAIQYCDRWRVLTVAASVGTLRRFGSVRGRLPCLEDLSVNIHDTAVDTHQIVDAFEWAPRLRRVELAGPVDPAQLRLPWSQLTTLAISFNAGYHTHEDLQSTITRPSSLSDLSIYYNWERGGIGAVHIRPVTLPHLQSLTVQVYDIVGFLFDIIRCPALQSLSVEMSHSLWTDGTFLSFLAAIQSLQKFEILFNTHDDIASPNLIPCLHAVPTVASLRIVCDRNESLGSKLLSEMTHPGGDRVTCVLPALKSLDLDARVDDWDQYLDMVRSRTSDIAVPGLAQLEELTPVTMYGLIPQLQSMLASRGCSHILRLRKDMNSLIHVSLDPHQNLRDDGSSKSQAED